MAVGFPRQEYWSGFSCPPPGDLPNPGTELASPGSSPLAGGFPTIVSPGKSQGTNKSSQVIMWTGVSPLSPRPTTLPIFSLPVTRLPCYPYTNMGAPSLGPMCLFFCLECLPQTSTWLVPSLPLSICSNVTFSVKGMANHFNILALRIP